MLLCCFCRDGRALCSPVYSQEEFVDVTGEGTSRMQFVALRPHGVNSSEFPIQIVGHRTAGSRLDLGSMMARHDLGVGSSSGDRWNRPPRNQVELEPISSRCRPEIQEDEAPRHGMTVPNFGLARPFRGFLVSVKLHRRYRGYRWTIEDGFASREGQWPIASKKLRLVDYHQLDFIAN